MLVFGTEMHLITFIFVVLELCILCFQLAFFLIRPKDEQRQWYVILLVLLLVYNITGGLFPDPNISIPIYIQNIIAYGTGFIMASYFPFYFYKAFHFSALRFHAIYGVFLFLLLPYLIFFVIDYSIEKDLNNSIKYGIIIPFIYSIVLLERIYKSMRIKQKQNSNQQDYFYEIAVYFAVVPWAALTVFSYYQVDQSIEVLFTNSGFIIVSMLFNRQAVFKSRQEYKESQELKSNEYDSTLVEYHMDKYQFTKREKEIVRLVLEGYARMEISKKLFISQRTVSTHLTNVYEKAGVSNKLALSKKLESKK